MPALTPQQVEHFKTFGLLVLRGYLTPDEQHTLAAEHEAALDDFARRSSTPFDGTARQCVRMLSDATPLHATLPEDPRFAGAAQQLYGGDAFSVGGDANRYVGASDWHCDHAINPLEDCHGVKFCIFHDPVGPNSGALRVIP